MALKMTSGTVTIFDLVGRIRKVLGFNHDETTMPAVEGGVQSLQGETVCCLWSKNGQV